MKIEISMCNTNAICLMNGHNPTIIMSKKVYNRSSVGGLITTMKNRGLPLLKLRVEIVTYVIVAHAVHS